MAKSLLEYSVWLDEQKLLWPKPPEVKPAKATPYIKPLPGIKAVTWSIYGTLLHISDGKLLHLHPQEVRMQIALEKTIEQFNMWASMTRKPGAPWEYMLSQYREMFSTLSMQGTKKRGEIIEINSADLWRKLIDRLVRNGYKYDVGNLGEINALSAKVAYFFHASLQGIEAMPHALEALQFVSDSYRRQGLLGNAQCFTFVQLIRGLNDQGRVPPLEQLFASNLFSFSFQVGVRAPSESLYKSTLKQFAEHGIRPNQILHIGCRMSDDLVTAKKLGFRTALFAGSELSLQAKKEDLQDPDHKPDRLITDLRQVADLLSMP